MGWIWIDDEAGSDKLNPSSFGGEINEYRSDSDSDGGKLCSTRKVVKTQCKTEEVEPGKFLRKCEKTEEILRECLGQPAEVVKSNKEYTEEDVTDLINKGSSTLGKFDDSTFGFPGLKSDIEGIERHFLGGINRFFEAAEQMRNSIFDTFGELYKENPSAAPSMRRGIPIEDYPRREESSEKRDPGVDLSGLARDV